MRLRSIATLILLAGTALAEAPPPNAIEAHVSLRTRAQPFPADGTWQEAHLDATLDTAKTAIVITDMWDQHWCAGANVRVAQVAQKMEPLLEEARRRGVLIIHAPSDTMSFYANTPERLAAQNAPKVTPPVSAKIDDLPLPIDDRDGGCDTPGYKEHRTWSRETSALKIAPGDFVSDNGNEIYNVLQQHHIQTVLYMGVHANMCILNRTFGIRQMTKWGMHCVLVRDLTDAMYNPASRPFVSHAAGTEMVIEYIEAHYAPTATSADLRAALKAGRPPANPTK